MTPDVRSDWLQHTLREAARRLRRPDVASDDLAWCANQLERIVDDLQSPTEFEGGHNAEVIAAAATEQPQPAWVRPAVATAIGVGLVYIVRRLLFRRDET